MDEMKCYCTEAAIAVVAPPLRNATCTSTTRRAVMQKAHWDGDLEVGTTDITPNDSERGAIGYIVLWLMGVPASILFLVFLMRGCT